MTTFKMQREEYFQKRLLQLLPLATACASCSLLGKEQGIYEKA